MSGRLPAVARAFTDEDVAAVSAVLESGWLTMGPRIKALEEQLADWSGAPHALVVSSGTAALQLALRALGVERDAAVAVPAYAGLGPAAAPGLLGARAAAVDVAAADAPVLDPAGVPADAAAAIVTHALGWRADVAVPGGVPVVEDATQALGADLGPAGPRTIRCFSLSAASQLPVGEGGIVACWDDDHAAAVRSLRSHAMTSGTWDRHRGHHDSYDVVELGYNFRLDEPRAALAAARLPRLAAEVQARRATVAALREALSGTGFAVPFDAAADATASPAVLPVLAPDRAARDAALARLGEAGETAVAWEAGGALPRAQETADRLLLVAFATDVHPDQAGRVAARCA